MEMHIEIGAEIEAGTEAEEEDLIAEKLKTQPCDEAIKTSISNNNINNDIDEDASLDFFMKAPIQDYTNFNSTSKNAISTEPLTRQEAIKKAISLVKCHKIKTLAEAARRFGIPSSTLSDHWNGKASKCFAGPNRQLTDEEEKGLLSALKYLFNAGWPLSRADARLLIKEVVGDRPNLFSDSGPSDKWFRILYKRHPELKDLEANNNNQARHGRANNIAVDLWFQRLRVTLEHLGIQNMPNRIFNADEISIKLKIEDSDDYQRNKKKNHTAADLRFANATKIMDCQSDKNNVTAHMCIKGDGTILPSFIIYSQSFPHEKYKVNVPSDWLFGVSEDGRMDSDFFVQWLDKTFIPNCGSERPVLLIIDNSMHMSKLAMDKARSNQITILGLPAYMSHLLQPLQVTIFGSLSDAFIQICSSIIDKTNRNTIKRTMFPYIWNLVITETCTPDLIKQSFRDSGIIPLNKYSIDWTEVKTVAYASTKVKRNGRKRRYSDSNSGSEEETRIRPFHQSSIKDTNLCPNKWCKQCQDGSPANVLMLKLLEDVQNIFLQSEAEANDEKQRATLPNVKLLMAGDKIKRVDQEYKNQIRREKMKRSVNDEKPLFSNDRAHNRTKNRRMKSEESDCDDSDISSDDSLDDTFNENEEVEDHDDYSDDIHVPCSTNNIPMLHIKQETENVFSSDGNLTEDHFILRSNTSSSVERPKRNRKPTKKLFEYEMEKRRGNYLYGYRTGLSPSHDNSKSSLYIKEEQGYDLLYSDKSPSNADCDKNNMIIMNNISGQPYEETPVIEGVEVMCETEIITDCLESNFSDGQIIHECHVCCKSESESETVFVWIQCKVCCQWYHSYCIKDYVTEIRENQVEYTCSYCVK